MTHRFKPSTRFLHVLIVALCLMMPLSAPATAQINPYDALMVKGRAALSADRTDAALRYFSAARKIAPLDPRPHLAIAESFSRAGQARRAEAYMSYLLTGPGQRANAARYADAIGILQRRHPFVTSASFALLPSTNINNVSSESNFETLLGRFEIENGGEETSGVGAEFGIQGRYRLPLARGRSFELGAALNHVWYETAALRYWRGRVTADLVQRDGAHDLRGGIHLDRTYYPDVDENRSDRLAIGLHGAWSRALKEDARLTVSGLIEHRAYIDKDSLSGVYSTLGLGYTKRHKDGSAYTVSASVERSIPSLGYHRYFGATVRAGYDRNVTDHLRAGIDASATLRVYDEDFAAVDYHRRDEIYRIGFSVSDKRLTMFDATPKLSCGYKVQSSNISLYSSNTTDCRIGWSYRF
ncbi:surface lipoprotein assembly modifier [Albirhodobacter sp. R86504]|uniref:surface lipoprotein assembly modifier n=1 Tax=Albirhodobacter sp. R86504 TaxID=3093848 RepID=UPI0036711509